MSLFENPQLIAWWRRWHLDTWGVILGGLMFAAATTPSLLPRSFTYQGLACGFSAASGYGLGVFLHWNWRTWARDVAVLLGDKIQVAWEIRLPRPRELSEKTRVGIDSAVIIIVLLWLVRAAYQSVKWQTEIFDLFGMHQSSPWNMWVVLPLGVGVWLGVLLLAHAIMVVARAIIRAAPGSWTVSSRTFFTWVLVIFFAIWSIDSLIPGTIVRVTERGFALQNNTYDKGLEQVYRPERSGSPQSLNSSITLIVGPVMLTDYPGFHCG